MSETTADTDAEANAVEDAPQTPADADAATAVDPHADAATAADDAPRAQFDELAAGAMDNTGAGVSDEVELDVILDVPVTLSLEVGRTRISIRDLLRLNQGSVVELDRPADQPMDVRVNGTLIARAEIVVVDDMFGIRLIDVVSPSERIRKIN